MTPEQQSNLQQLIDRRFDQFSLNEVLDAESGALTCARAFPALSVLELDFAEKYFNAKSDDIRAAGKDDYFLPIGNVRRHSFEESVTILVVDNERVVRDLCAIVLAGAGYNVLSAEDAYRALEISKTLEGPVHLALIDTQMPKMRPELLVELLDCLVPRNLDIRFMLMSGFTQLPREQDTKGHHYSFLQKPFTSAGLLERVERELR